MNVQKRIAQIRRAQDEFNAQVEAEIEQVKQDEDIQRHLQAFGRQHARMISKVKVATWDGWKALGIHVRQGEKAHDVNGMKVFHVTQTTAHGC